MTSSPMCPRTVGETGGLRQRLPSRPKSWSRQSGWPEKRMIITRVTETAQGSNGRATHPRFWSAWELCSTRGGFAWRSFEVGGGEENSHREA